MRLPFLRFGRGSDPAVVTELDAVAERLDRLIAIGERTNQLLEQLQPPAITQPNVGEGDQAESARVPDAPTHVATQRPGPRQTGPVGRRQRRKTGSDELRRSTSEAPRRLHEAIIRVLLDAGEPLTAKDIAGRIRERNLFEPPRSGHELRGGQVSARVGNATYRDRFLRREGRIWLRDPDDERRRAGS